MPNNNNCTPPISNASLPLCGRQHELTTLQSYSQRPGITLINAPAQIGKSRLLHEWIDSLNQHRATSPLWGYARAYQGCGQDIIELALYSLYDNWQHQTNTTSNSKQHFLRVQQQGITGLGPLATALLDNLNLDSAIPSSVVINNTLQTLNKAQHCSENVNVLHYEHTFDLCQLIFKLSGRPIVLVLDAFEHSTDQQGAQRILSRYLDNIDHWPSLHVVIAQRTASDKAHQQHTAAQPWRPNSNHCHSLTLDTIELNNYPQQKHQLANYLIEQVRALTPSNINRYLAKSHGHPGIWQRWVDENCQSEHELTDHIQQVQQSRYTALASALGQLDQQTLSVVIRLALMPQLDQLEIWSILEPVVLLHSSTDILDQLHQTGILQSNTPPCFGATLRYEYTRQWLIQNHAALCASQMTQSIALISRLAVEFNHPVTVVTAVGVLLSWARLAEQLPCDSGVKEFCLLAEAIIGRKLDITIFKQAKLFLQQHPSTDCITLYACELSNAVSLCKADCDVMTVLQTLRQLQQQWPQNHNVREQLCRALATMHCQISNFGEAESLLDELRQLQYHFADDSAVAEALASGLIISLCDDFPDRPLEHEPDAQSVLDELRTLQQQWPNNTILLEHFAIALLHCLSQSDYPTTRSSLFNELRELQKHTDNAIVRECLGDMILTMLANAQADTERYKLLAQLRNLQQARPNDSKLREQLAEALFITLNEAEQSISRNKKLQQLRELQQTWPHDTYVRKCTARALVEMISSAQSASVRAAHLTELRQLHQQWPKDAALRQQLVIGMFDAAISYLHEDQTQTASLLVESLVAFCNTYPQDPIPKAMTEQLEKLQQHTEIAPLQ